MHAIGLNRFGGPEVLEQVELPDPHPALGQVRVRVRAAGINPVDVMFRDGTLAAMLANCPPPCVPGMDLSGTIDEIGEDASRDCRLRIGMDVVGIVDNHGSYGAYSEYVCLPAASVIERPAGVSFPEAASFLMNALTARNALDALRLPSGSTLLVTGAAGGVGSYVVALARDDGLRVVAVGADGDEAFLRKTGANEVVPRGPELIERIKVLAPNGVDAVVDCAGLGGAAVASTCRDDAMIIALRFGGEVQFERGVHAVFVNVRDRSTDQAAIARLAQQVAEGTLALRVAEVFRASEATAAHHRFDAGGLRGRVILDFDSAGW